MEDHFREDYWRTGFFRQKKLKKAFYKLTKEWAIFAETAAGIMREYYSSFGADIDSSAYSFRFSAATEYSYKGGYRDSNEIYWDAPFGLVMKHYQTEIACIGFFPHRDIDTVYINQIQGVYGKKALMPPKWERFLVVLLMEMSRIAGFSRIKILPGEKNSWYLPSRSETYIMRYNVTAQRLGFKRSGDGDYFSKDL